MVDQPKPGARPSDKLACGRVALAPGFIQKPAGATGPSHENPCRPGAEIGWLVPERPFGVQYVIATASQPHSTTNQPGWLVAVTPRGSMLCTLKPPRLDNFYGLTEFSQCHKMGA